MTIYDGDAEWFMKQEAIPKQVNREDNYTLELQLICVIKREKLVAAQVQDVYSWLWSENIPVDCWPSRRPQDNGA